MTWLRSLPKFPTFICCGVFFFLCYFPLPPPNELGCFYMTGLWRVTGSWTETIFGLFLHLLSFISLWGVFSYNNAQVIANSTWLGRRNTPVLSSVLCSVKKQFPLHADLLGRKMRYVQENLRRRSWSKIWSNPKLWLEMTDTDSCIDHSVNWVDSNAFVTIIYW